MTAAPQKTPKPAKTVRTAISPTRSEDYSEWYQQVIRGADMAEMSGVRGCMVIKPWGWGIWERIQKWLDAEIKATGHENCYFPLFIPLSLLEKEEGHAEGFAKEMAVVTHHRLISKDGKLIPDPSAELNEPLIVRPTSETVIGEAFARWVQSYRDLPVLINQWANVVRWEMRPRIFLRTAEFLWQEGHTAHETESEARQEVMKMLEVYRTLAEDVMAMPVICGEKTENERFAGAVTTTCIEAMMQDGKALQAGTSHYLGQNFAKAANISFQNKSGGIDLVHTTSWGVSTRLIGGLIMTHADDDGLKLPPRLAPQQIVIVPILRDESDRESVMEYAESVLNGLQAQQYAGEKIRAKLDTRDLPAPDKRWGWIKKGVPLILEIGPRDVAEGKVAVLRRDKMADGKQFVAKNDFVNGIVSQLTEIQAALLQTALTLQKSRTVTDITTLEQFKAYFSKSGDSSFNDTTGFVRAKWCGDPESEKILKEMAVTIRCIPFDQDGKTGTCVLTGKPATQDVIFARSY